MTEQFVGFIVLLIGLWQWYFVFSPYRVLKLNAGKATLRLTLLSFWSGIPFSLVMLVLGGDALNHAIIVNDEQDLITKSSS
ncbi:hypothetical protein ACLJJ6_10510 [Pediococcus siamensis]|uniref:hypothetical protein n=1 Tax=Pediococcus siamensis TaxID=381829 RepID=UPI0039A32950